MSFRRSLFLLLFCVFGLAPNVVAQQRRTSDFVGTSIPEPPQQKTPWTAPQAEPQLPLNLISATTRLFEQGLADPRGAEYREIEVMIFRALGREFTVKTHGWALPAAASAQRYAVCWNGLVYPVDSLGNEVDLASDVEAAIRSDEELQATWAKTNTAKFYRFHDAKPDSYSIAQSVLLPLRACLLLRLNQKDLAKRVWTTWVAGMDPKINNDSANLADPYLMLAIDWLWAMYDRAVTAHTSGDDSLCLISALRSQSMGNSIRQEIESRALPGGYRQYLNFLEPLRLLIQDQERRARHPRATSVPRDQRVLRQQTTAQLIDYLDEAIAIQEDYPGGIDMSQDSVVRELIRRDKDAVEPLLAALENDTRLTRAVRSSRPWHYDRHFMTVYETAHQALRSILSIGNNDLQDWETIEKGPEGRRVVAARLRALAQR